MLDAVSLPLVQRGMRAPQGEAGAVLIFGSVDGSHTCHDRQQTSPRGLAIMIVV